MVSRTKIMGVALASALALASCPAAALAADGQPQAQVRTVTWTSLEDRPAFDRAITVDGAEYALAGEPAVREVERIRGEVPATRTDWKECAPDALDATVASFPASYHVDEDGFEGDIPRTGVSYEEVNAVQEYELNVTRETKGLPSNDAAQIPGTITVQGESGDVELALAGLSWVVEGTDARGLPSSYTAKALYRGKDARVELDHYTVTAEYAGTVQSKEEAVVYEATLAYEAVPAKDEGLGILPIVAGAVAAAGITLIGVFIPVARRRSRAYFYLLAQDARTLKTTRTKMGSSKLFPEGNTITAATPKHMPLGLPAEVAHYEVELPKRYVGAGYVFRLVQNGGILFEGPAARVIVVTVVPQ